MAPELFTELATSLLLGLLVGLQRQRTESSVGGIRTYPLIAAFGTLSGWLAIEHGGWIIAAGLIALAALLVVSNFMLARSGDTDSGQTSEVAALLLYGIGAYVVFGDKAVAVVLGGAIAVLLHYKDMLHSFAAKIGARDVTAIMQFVLITLVILPVLPNQAYGPYAVLNPFQIWLMVVLIVGISLIGYVAYKFFGAQRGAVLGGLLGGLISSTATTVSFARRTATAPASAGLAALVIMIASGSRVRARDRRSRRRGARSFPPDRAATHCDARRVHRDRRIPLPSHTRAPRHDAGARQPGRPAHGHDLRRHVCADRVLPWQRPRPSSARRGFTWSPSSPA